MREIVYQYDRRGSYQTEADTAFGEDTHLKLVAKPHEFTLTVQGETLRSTAFEGCSAVVSCNGEVTFFEADGCEIGKVHATEACFVRAILCWKEGMAAVQFGRTITVDHYPNCDGESDRWSEKWVVEREVTLDTQTKKIEVTAP